MSETSNGMPDLTAGDNEPSMEDILSSIRKIIADDKTDEAILATESSETAADSLETASPSVDIADVMDEVDPVEMDDLAIPDSQSIEDSIDDIAEELGDDSDSAEILELINLAEETTDLNENSEIIEEALEIDDVEVDIASPDDTTQAVEFDESLDLVMDADASDYLTTDLASKGIDTDSNADENAALREEIASDFSLDEAPVISDESIDVLDELSLDDVDTELEAPSLDDAEEDVEGIEEIASFDEDSASPGDDQDMDLVKSLLADLMDEPEDESEFEAEAEDYLEEVEAEDEASETADNILDEILYQTIDDEEAIAESEKDSGLARIARNARESVADQPELAEISDEDTVILPERDVKGRLSLSTKTVAASAAAVAVTVAATTKADDTDEEDGEFWSTEINEGDDDDEALEALVEEIVKEDIDTALDESAEELTQIQEEEPMGRAVKKKEPLVDKETEQESSDAFAELTTAVRLKEESQDSGPPIGDLVQEALKPMLSEWLDKNLKGIVERAVTKEVKRISSGK